MLYRMFQLILSKTKFFMNFLICSKIWKKPITTLHVLIYQLHAKIVLYSTPFKL